MSDDVNLNVAKCLKEATDFGVNHIHNICNGAEIDVPWGTVDWLGCFGAIAFVVVVIFMLGSLACAMISDF